MFNIGDLIIYSTHGVCRIDDICKKSYSNVSREYYILYPVEDPDLKISVPVNSDRVVMLDIMDKEEAEKVLKFFEEPGIEWIEDAKVRNKKYTNIIKGGDRREIIKLASTLMLKQMETEHKKERMYNQDQKMLEDIQGNLFQELAASLETTVEKIIDKINATIPSKI